MPFQLEIGAMNKQWSNRMRKHIRNISCIYPWAHLYALKRTFRKVSKLSSQWTQRGHDKCALKYMEWKVRCAQYLLMLNIIFISNRLSFISITTVISNIVCISPFISPFIWHLLLILICSKTNWQLGNLSLWFDICITGILSTFGRRCKFIEIAHRRSST